MAVKAADYYWLDVFTDLNSQADREIAYASKSGPLNDSERKESLYISGLVEPQRMLLDLYHLTIQAKETEAKTILTQFEGLANISNTLHIVKEWFNLDDLKTSAVLRVCCRNALSTLVGLCADDMKRAIQIIQDQTVCDEDKEMESEYSELIGLKTLLKQQNEWPSRRKTDSGQMQIIPHMIPPILSNVSAPKFTLDEVPLPELRQRLGRGEIAPRDEWIPSDDKTNKKLIPKEEMQQRLTFGRKLLKEAKEALITNRTADSLTLYTQGVHLLEYYKCEQLADTMELCDELNKFRRNKAILDIKLGNFRAAIAACTDCLQEQPNDGKAMFLRGRAYWLVGETDRAQDDFKKIMSNAYCSDEHHKAATEALRQVLLEQRKNDVQIRNIIRGIDTKHQWTEAKDHNDYDDDDETDTSSNGKETKSVPSRKHSSYMCSRPLPIEPELFIELMRDLIRLYTTPRIRKDLERIQFNCEYDEKKIIRNLRKFLPPHVESIFIKYGVPGNNYDEMKFNFDKWLGQLRISSLVNDELKTELHKLTSEARELLVGGEEVT